MNLTAMKNVVTSSFGRKILLTQKHSPKLLFVLGVAGFAGTVYLAVRATFKMEDVVKSTEDQLNAIDEEHLSEKEYKKARSKIQIQAAIATGKIYAPAFAVGVISIGALAGAHTIQFRRLGGLSAAYAAVDQGFREYRKRVTDELGAEKDAQFRYGLVEEEVFVRDSDTGPIIEKVMRPNPDVNVTMYAKKFEQGNPNWRPGKHDNSTFIRVQQEWANERLTSQGYLFLSDVYVALGFKETQASRVVGWIKSNDSGDGYIDFGLFSGNPHLGIQFVNGETQSIVLDFNVDGEVYKMLED